MLKGNQLQKALVENSLVEAPKEKKWKYRGKQFKCNKCGAPMIMLEDVNAMACSNCNGYFIFDEKN